MKVQKPDKKKSTKVLLSVLFILGILVFIFLAFIKIIGSIPLTKTQQKEKVQSIFLDMGIDTCSIGNITFRFFNGISLHDVTLIEQIDHTKKITCKFSVIEIQYYPMKTLLKWNTCKKILRNKIDKFLYENPAQQDNIIFNSQKFKERLLPLLYDEISGSNTILFSCVSKIQLTSDFIVIDSVNSQILHFQNLSAALNTEENIPSNLEVHIAIERASFYDNFISSFHSAVHFDGPGCITTFKCDSIFNGSLEGNFLFDLPKNSINDGKLSLDSIDIKEVYTFYKYKEGSLDGTCSIHIEFDSSIADLAMRSYTGSGSIQAINVNARKLPILNQIAEVTMLSGLSDLNFEKITGDFTFGKGIIKSKNLSAKGDPVSIDLSGWVKPDSTSFSINLKGTFQSYYKDSIPSIVWETMFPENEKGRSFKCTIYGTQESPSISVDKNFATRAINNVIKTIGDELKSFFK